MDLAEYQERAAATDERKNLPLSIAGLVGEVGSIVSTYKKRLLQRSNYPAFSQEMEEELGDILWYLSSVASLAGLNLNDLAERNLKKAYSLFDEGNIHRFDANFPTDEQFPRKFDVLFTEKEIGNCILCKPKGSPILPLDLRQD